MKKFFAFILAFALTLPATGSFAADSINVIVNGEALDFGSDQGPVIQDGRTLVPFRAVFEKMGAEVKWFEDIKLCEATYGQITAGITIGSSKVVLGDAASVDGDVPAQIINGRTMVPLRVIAESIGAQVGWDAETKTVNIQTPAVSEAPASVEYEMGYAGGTNMDTGFSIDYEYPIVKSDYTMANKLNENIYNDISKAVDDTLNNYTGDKKLATITCNIRYNESGLFSLQYLIDGELFFYPTYSIIDGVAADNDALAAMMSVSDEQRYTIETYTVERKAEDGSNYITATAEYPVFTETEDFIPSLNTQIYNSAVKAVDSFIADYEDAAKKLYDDPSVKLFGVPYSYYNGVYVAINDNIAKVTNTYTQSLYESDTENTDTYSIDMTTGKVTEG